MRKPRKLGPTVWMTLLVYLFIVGSGLAIAGRCCYADGDQNAHRTDGCANSHEHAAGGSTGHDCASESDHGATDGPCCNCSILPIGAANSSVLSIGAVAASAWMHGAASALCLFGSALDSETSGGGGRYPPQLSDLKPILFSLQTVFLLI